MAKAIAAEGKAEGRVSGNNSWPINELQLGDVYVADRFGKIVDGTLIGSNLGSAIAAHTHTGFVFNAGIRDQEENREIADLNGFYRGADPSFWTEMTLTSINSPIRIGRATVHSRRPGAGEDGWCDFCSRNSRRGGREHSRVHQAEGRVQL